MDTRWREIGERVFVRRNDALDQTIGLLVGEEFCLVVDTGTDETHGAELAAAVRTVTRLPWLILITHAHWDHFFGTASFTGPTPGHPVLAHPRCRAEIAENEAEHRANGLRYYAAHGQGTDSDAAKRLATARVVVPTDPVEHRVDVDLGGRTVELIHPGRGHTAGDVVAYLPDAAVLFAGDLVEQGAPPAIGSDAYPLDWPSSVDTLLRLPASVVVPGHGEPVDRAFVHTQRDELAQLAALCREVSAGRLSSDEAVRRSPFGEDTTRQALSLIPA